ncbi:hypothetical protein ACH5RR_021923 [Cinchona calisaya]|uniref:Uncharacterized protein n=1 Tax=Cinchona calisaya TaxID=153742 RepID=A0ABD2Z886_9GENT
MRVLVLFRRGGYLGFFLTILLALNLCYGKNVQIHLFGSIEFTQCTTDVAKTWHPTSSGARLTIECKSPDGNFRTLGEGGVDGKGNFEINFLEAEILKDCTQKNNECFLKLHSSAAGAPCPVRKAKRILVMIFKSIDNVKQTSAIKKWLKFSSNSCTAAIPWPFYNDNLVQTSNRGHLENFVQAPVFVSRKLLFFPIKIFPPIIPYPFPPPSPSFGNPLPTPAPFSEEPQPPIHETPPPIYDDPLPLPSTPYIKKPSPLLPPLDPTYKNPLPPPITEPLPPVAAPTPLAYYPCNPPILSPGPLPEPKPSQNPALSPLYTAKPPPPASPRYSFSPIPRAPPIPTLPPNPTVPRRFFNLPKSPTPPTQPRS